MNQEYTVDPSRLVSPDMTPADTEEVSLRPKTLVNALETNNGVHPGFRRNHSKGVCVIGHFESSGEARSYSSAQVFNEARTPVVGRFALPAGNPYAPDSAVPIRSLALRFTQANGQQWRTGMNSMPVFPVGTSAQCTAVSRPGFVARKRFSRMNP